MLLHLTDSETLDFQAQVIRQLHLPDGRPAVVLDRTYFYPTGGGQEHDTGTLGPAQVVEVIKEGDEAVHVLDREIPMGPVNAHIDPQRRLANSHQHTAQHLLSACFLSLLGLNTISVHLKGDAPSSLDLDAPPPNRDEIDQVEALANQIIWEDREVRYYFVYPEQLQDIHLRGHLAVTENIRIVEIEGLDSTACGGTHVARTGMLGLIKILRFERQGSATRVWFVTGVTALQTFQQYQDVIQQLASQLGVGTTDLVPFVQRQAEQLKTAQQDIQRLHHEQLVAEADRLAAGAEAINRHRFIGVVFPDRPREEMRQLATALKELPQTISVLATISDQSFSVIVTCSEDIGLSARDLLAATLSEIGGRGGGNRTIAQGGGTGTMEQIQNLVNTIRSSL